MLMSVVIKFSDNTKIVLRSVIKETAAQYFVRKYTAQHTHIYKVRKSMELWIYLQDEGKKDVRDIRIINEVQIQEENLFDTKSPSHNIMIISSL